MKDTEIFPLRAEAHHPWHLYAGVVLSGSDEKIAIVKDDDGSYTLPRETLASDDNFIGAIHRLILEQVKVIPTVTQYLGSLTKPFVRYDGVTTQKTVIYFQAEYQSPYHGKFVTDAPATSSILWMEPKEAMEFLAQQPNKEDEVVARMFGPVPVTPIVA